MEKIPVEKFIKELWKIMAAFRNPGGPIVRRLMGNTVVLFHNTIRLNFVRKRDAAGNKWPALSEMTLIMKSAAGRGNRLGFEKGTMYRAIGPRLGKDEGRASNRDFIRWTTNGYTLGENLPAYAKYFDKRIAQRWTDKQRAFLMIKLKQAQKVTELKDIVAQARKAQNYARKHAGFQHFANLATSSVKHVAKKARSMQAQFRKDYEDLSGDLGSVPGQKKKRKGKIHIKPARHINRLVERTIDRGTRQLRNDIIDFMLHPDKDAG